MDEERTSIIPRDEVHILVTEEDKTGEDILAMSDFFDGYVQQLTEAIKTSAVTTYVPSIPIADIGIIGEVNPSHRKCFLSAVTKYDMMAAEPRCLRGCIQ